jgi:hypothetical protein
LRILSSKGRRFDRAIAALREITGPAATVKRSPAVKKAARHISPAGKARIAEAQRQRWAAKRRAEAPHVRKKATAAAGTVTKKFRGKQAPAKATTPGQS